MWILWTRRKGPPRRLHYVLPPAPPPTSSRCAAIATPCAAQEHRCKPLSHSLSTQQQVSARFHIAACKRLRSGVAPPRPHANHLQSHLRSLSDTQAIRKLFLAAFCPCASSSTSSLADDLVPTIGSAPQTCRRLLVCITGRASELDTAPFCLPSISRAPPRTAAHELDFFPCSLERSIALHCKARLCVHYSAELFTDRHPLPAITILNSATEVTITT